MHSRRSAPIFATLLTAVSLMTGCRIGKNDLGNYSNVKVATPFGGLLVKTNDTTAVPGLGLPDYPGAELQLAQSDSGATEVNLSLGSLHLRINTASYKSADSPDKLIAFYRQALSRYGEVIECQDGLPVGTSSRTPEGLTCDKEKSADFYSDNPNQILLKAGFKQHQHLVAINPDSAGTKLQIVAVDLPGHHLFW